MNKDIKKGMCTNCGSEDIKHTCQTQIGGELCDIEEDIIRKLGKHFQYLRYMNKWSMTSEKGLYRARGFSFIPPHHHKTVNGHTSTEALENLWKAVQYK